MDKEKGLTKDKKKILKNLIGIITVPIDLNKMRDELRHNNPFILNPEKADEFINHTNHEDLKEIMEAANKFNQNNNKKGTN